MRLPIATSLVILSGATAHAEIDLSGVDCKNVKAVGPGVLHIGSRITIKDTDGTTMNISDQDLPKGFMGFKGKDAYTLVSGKCK